MSAAALPRLASDVQPAVDVADFEDFVLEDDLLAIQQMQQSGDPNTRELATDLASVKTQLVNACAPGQGGGQHAT
jgi:hypothetical protein